ncbi:RHS repeat-associated core domain-containing protein [Pseudomonas sp. GM55]|uniref:RHS repeat-associated core domain-containing protein n=1 Tax=Pseudomonas sp. GM55 TaxID=1144333 RepID=UPI00027087A5|nr:RHS repeat-associated core domain-containing protein [Pseudomonas sp. GM55]EJM72451.1 RHS repeat-associated core domain protein-containing protein [Pseudomonas sp. GM55]
MTLSHQNQSASGASAAPQRFSRTLLLTTDQQQSVLAELDSSNPNPFVYSPYGLRSSPRQAGTHLGFNGQLMERSTGCYHLGNGHRVYNPVLMRFHSPDRLSPFGKGGINAYAYSMGDPLNYTDPSGQSVLSVFQLGQRALLTTLHVTVPLVMLAGPKVSGVALQATRLSLLGSVGTAVGAAMSAAGLTAGTYVITAGTIGLLGGAIIRGAVAAKAAIQKGVLWKTVRDNAKNILGWSVPKKVIEPDVPLAVISHRQPSPPSSTNIRTDAPVPPEVDAVNIRRS